MVDSHGFFAGELAAGGIVWTAVGASNAWNPVGWVILGAIVVVATIAFLFIITKSIRRPKTARRKKNIKMVCEVILYLIGRT